MRRVKITTDGSAEGRELARLQREQAIAQANADGVDVLEVWTIIYVGSEGLTPPAVQPSEVIAPVKEIAPSTVWTHPQLEGEVSDE